MSDLERLFRIFSKARENEVIGFQLAQDAILIYNVMSPEKTRRLQCRCWISSGLIDYKHKKSINIKRYDHENHIHI